jgi:alpha-beta hydrolase superfamily lysophospholipase
MKHEELTWNTFDGLLTYAQYWKQDSGDCKAVICLVHGHGEHSSRYGHVAKMFTDHGYAVIAFDLRGHGLTKGQRGHTPTYDALLNDVELLLAKADSLFPGKKKIIYGHSMGGNIVTNYLLRRHPDVVAGIATGPFFRLAFQPPAFQLWLGKNMNKIWGAFPDHSKLNPDHISKDKEVVRKYKEDPLVHDNISARLGMSLIESGEWAIAHAHELKVPLLVMHGTDDQLTSAAGSEAFARNAGKMVKYLPFQGMYHEIHNEPDKASVFKAMIEWCDQHIQ